MLIFYKWLGFNTKSVQTPVFTLQIRSYSKWFQVPTIEYRLGHKKGIGFYNRRSVAESEVFNRMMSGESIRVEGTIKEKDSN